MPLPIDLPQLCSTSAEVIGHRSCSATPPEPREALHALTTPASAADPTGNHNTRSEPHRQRYSNPHNVNPPHRWSPGGPRFLPPSLPGCLRPSAWRYSLAAVIQEALTTAVDFTVDCEWLGRVDPSHSLIVRVAQVSHRFQPFARTRSIAQSTSADGLEGNAYPIRRFSP